MSEVPQLGGAQPRIALIGGAGAVRRDQGVEPRRRPLYSPGMHYLQTDPVLMDDSRLVKLLAGIQRTSYDEGIRLTMEELDRGRSR